MNKWMVMPLCEKQLRDVRSEHILENGLYRLCDTYKAGGGYDRFPEIAKKKLNRNVNLQFVVQLKGCPLRCPYCYVTPDGISSNTEVLKTSNELANAYMKTDANIFHLMGGAPAIYIEHWNELIDKLPKGTVFHSDMLLIEKEYPKDVLKELAKKKNALFAVSIKGCNSEEFKNNTGIELNKELFQYNLYNLVDIGVPIYLTYTGMNELSIQKFKEDMKKNYIPDYIFNDSFAINLVNYKALQE